MKYNFKNYTSEYYILRGMISRCKDEKDKGFHNYGGRGIKIQESWLGKNGFENFMSYIGPRPSKEHSIDRINNDGNYEEGNVKWSTRKEQANNTRINRFVKFNDRIQTIAMWADELGMNPKLIQERLARGWSPEDALNPEKMNMEGSNNPSCKLSKQDVIEIYKSKEEYRILIEKYKTTMAAISRIKNRVRFKAETEGLGRPGRSDNPNNARKNK